MKFDRYHTQNGRQAVITNQEVTSFGGQFGTRPPDRAVHAFKPGCLNETVFIQIGHVGGNRVRVVPDVFSQFFTADFVRVVIAQHL